LLNFAGYEHGTKVIAQATAESSAFSIAGGGDTLASIAKYGIEGDVGLHQHWWRGLSWKCCPPWTTSERSK